MRSVLPVFFIFAFVSAAFAVSTEPFEPFGRFLESCASSGNLDAACAKENRPLLDHSVENIKGFPEAEFEALNRESRMSFLINAYNVYFIRHTLDHAGEAAEKIKELPAEIFKKTVTVGSIEEMIKRTFRDERVFVALYTGEKVAPPLSPQVYTGENLDRLLDENLRRFLNDPFFNRFDMKKKQVILSPVLHVHESDFLLNYGDGAGRDVKVTHQAALLSFIADYVDPDKREFLKGGGIKIRFMEPEDALSEPVEAV